MVEATHKEVIQLSEDDAGLARDAAAEVTRWLDALGRERERYLIVEAGIMNKLNEARKEFESLERALKSKHPSGPGQYVLRPEIGAFIRTPANGTPVKRET